MPNSGNSCLGATDNSASLEIQSVAQPRQVRVERNIGLRIPGESRTMQAESLLDSSRRLAAAGGPPPDLCVLKYIDPGGGRLLSSRPQIARIERHAIPLSQRNQLILEAHGLMSFLLAPYVVFNRTNLRFAD